MNWFFSSLLGKARRKVGDAVKNLGDTLRKMTGSRSAALCGDVVRRPNAGG